MQSTYEKLSALSLFSLRSFTNKTLFCFAGAEDMIKTRGDTA
jgi:hypothetical protein